MIISTAVLAILIYTLINKYPSKCKITTNAAQVPQPDDDPDKIKARQKAQAEQDAFEELLGYSIDTAYGIKHEE